MMRTKSGNIKKEHQGTLNIVADALMPLIEKLLEKKLTPEEIIGIISGQTTISVSTLLTKKRIKNEEKL